MSRERAEAESPASAGRGEEAGFARQAVYEALPPDEKMLFLDVLTREMEIHGDQDAAWDAAWRAVEDPFLHGLSDPRLPQRVAHEPEFPQIHARRRFDLEWHARRATDSGIPLAEALRHAEEDVADPGRRETDAIAQVKEPDREFLEGAPEGKPRKKR